MQPWINGDPNNNVQHMNNKGGMMGSDLQVTAHLTSPGPSHSSPGPIIGMPISCFCMNGKPIPVKIYIWSFENTPLPD